MTLARLSIVVIVIFIFTALFLVTCGKPEFPPETKSLIQQYEEYAENTSSPTLTPPVTPSDNITKPPTPIRVEVYSELGFLEEVKIYDGKDLIAVQNMGAGGDVVRADLYDKGMVKIQLFYNNGKIVKIVPFDEYGSPIEEQIKIMPVPVFRPY